MLVMSFVRRWTRVQLRLMSAVIALSSMTTAASAISIELKDVAPHRIERQKLAKTGKLPLPETPDLSKLGERLAQKGLKLGAPVFIRVFKTESKLEVWMKKDDRFIHFATYPVCNWSGTLGPKIAEGDKQTPEGFYTVNRRRLHLIGRWPRSLNLGFPNIFDQAHARTGSYILVHGGCSSVGCFAMTNAVMKEIYQITSRAIRTGRQRHVPIHVFPFHMTEDNMAKHKASPWIDFWQDLKAGYETFERTRIPPQVSVCRGRYVVRDADGIAEGDTRPLAVCGVPSAAVEISELLDPIVQDPSQWKSLSQDNKIYLEAALAPALKQDLISGKLKAKIKRRLASRVRSSRQANRRPGPRFKCNPRRPSCRKHMALQRRIWARKTGRLAKKSKARLSKKQIRRTASRRKGRKKRR